MKKKLVYMQSEFETNDDLLRWKWLLDEENVPIFTESNVYKQIKFWV